MERTHSRDPCNHISRQAHEVNWPPSCLCSINQVPSSQSQLFFTKQGKLSGRWRCRHLFHTSWPATGILGRYSQAANGSHSESHQGLGPVNVETFLFIQCPDPCCTPDLFKARRFRSSGPFPTVNKKNSSTSVCFEASWAQKDIRSRLLSKEKAGKCTNPDESRWQGAESFTSLIGSKG